MTYDNILLGRLRDEFYYNRKHINDNTATLKAKYEKKAAARSIEYIDDEQQYYIDHCNKDNSHQNEFAKVFSEIDMSDLPENEVCEDACEEVVVMDTATEFWNRCQKCRQD